MVSEQNYCNFDIFYRKMLTVNFEQQVTFLILSTSENLFAQFVRVSDDCITVLEVVKVDLFFGLAHFLEKEHASTQL